MSRHKLNMAAVCIVALIGLAGWIWISFVRDAHETNPAAIRHRDSLPVFSTIHRPQSPPRELPTHVESTGSSADIVYERAHACKMALEGVTLYERQLQVCAETRKESADGDNTRWEQSCKKKEDLYPPKISIARATLSGCGSQDDIGESYFFATEQAAQEGNIEAQLCYTTGLFDREDGWLEAETAEYQERATRYIDAGLERGDWRMVSLLWQSQFRPAGVPDLPATVLGSSRPSELRLNRLFRLGTTNLEFRKLLDIMPNGMGPPPTQNELRQADAWAQRIYRLYFTESEKISARPDVCPLTYKEVK